MSHSKCGSYSIGDVLTVILKKHLCSFKDRIPVIGMMFGLSRSFKMTHFECILHSDHYRRYLSVYRSFWSFPLFSPILTIFSISMIPVFKSFLSIWASFDHFKWFRPICIFVYPEYRSTLSHIGIFTNYIHFSLAGTLKNFYNFKKNFHSGVRIFVFKCFIKRLHPS